MQQKYKYFIYDDLEDAESLNSNLSEFMWITEAEHQLNVIKQIDEDEYNYKLDEFVELNLFKHEGSVSINGFTFKKEKK